MRVIELKLVQTGGMGASFSETYIDKWFVLDYMTGDIYSINKISLLEKFELWDQELYLEYKKTKGKTNLDIQLEFVRRFNQRNPIRF